MALFAWLMLHLRGRNESPQLPRQAKVAEAEELVGNAGIMGKGMGRGGMDGRWYLWFGMIPAVSFHFSDFSDMA